MSGRKTDFEERLMIIEELIKHDVNYNWAVEKYHISYQQIYGWYQKYRKSGNDPESLRDRRGKAKPEKEWTEVDRLKAENRLLKAKLQNQEMKIAFAKKLTEIRNREVNKASSSKPFKNWTEKMIGQSVNCVRQLKFHAMVIINSSSESQVVIRMSRRNCLKKF